MVLQKAVETLDHFPSISQIKEIADSFMANKTTRSESRIVCDSCPDCMGDGLLFLFNEHGYRYVFSCGSCRNGEIQRQISGQAAPHVSVGEKQGFMPRRRSI
jgi:hypothetical protein